MGKGTEISVPKWDDIEPYVTPDGQICIYPLYAAKARGGVIDEAFNKEALCKGIKLKLMIHLLQMLQIYQFKPGSCLIMMH